MGYRGGRQVDGLEGYEPGYIRGVESWGPVPVDMLESMSSQEPIEEHVEEPTEEELWREEVRVEMVRVGEEKLAEAASLKSLEDDALFEGDGAEADRLAAEAKRLEKLGMSLLGGAVRWANCSKIHFAHYCKAHPEKAIKGACSCNSRICPQCARRYRGRVLAGWEGFLSAVALGRFGGKLYGFKHLTLTKRRLPDVDIGEQVRQVLEESKQLIYHFWRRGGDWKGRGAIVSAELGPKGGNVHTHALVFGQRVDVKAISAKWEEITGGDMVVHIRRCAGSHIAEVLKYPLKTESLSPEEAVSVMLSLRGTRRFRCYGRFFNNEKLRVPKPEPMLCGECGGRMTHMPWDDWVALYGSQRKAYMAAVFLDARGGVSGRSPP